MDLIHKYIEDLNLEELVRAELLKELENLGKDKERLDALEAIKEDFNNLESAACFPDNLYRLWVDVKGDVVALAKGSTIREVLDELIKERERKEQENGSRSK